MKRFLLITIIIGILLFNLTGCKNVDNNNSLIDSTTELLTNGELPTDNTNLQKFTLEAPDGSAIVTQSDNVFYWYLDPKITDDNYYKGIIDFHQGQAAFDNVLKFPEKYGLNKEMFDQAFSNEGGGKLENFYVMTLTFTKYIVDGKDSSDFGQADYYFGFWMPDKDRLILKNLNTGKDIDFKVIKNDM